MVPSPRKVCSVLHRLLWAVFVAQALASVLVDLPYSYAAGWLPAVAAVLLGTGLALTARRAEAAAAARGPVEVAPPVAGTWSALNSPADRVPSHGTRAYGQAYAIDIVAEDPDRPRPAFAWFGPPARRPEAYPAFGVPLFAVADGTVVRAEDRLRDHRARSSLPGLLYLLVVESLVRAVAGVRQVTGNHLVLDLGGGTYALYAHLRRGSLRVRPGDRITAGQPLAACGNSGNSSEPHVHFQLMDGPDPDTASGIPFTWRGIGVPHGGEVFTAPPPQAPAEDRAQTQAQAPTLTDDRAQTPAEDRTRASSPPQAPTPPRTETPPQAPTPPQTSAPAQPPLPKGPSPHTPGHHPRHRPGGVVPER
ncbi:M23 family metallopeptidase [Streptomyces termitum]|uniref:M23 family metallopeptidase n=1 Tax=Streptomyces termitum TaxID=67368 RepID=UPI0037994612